jgi:hypothetical protein
MRWTPIDQLPAELKKLGAPSAIHKSRKWMMIRYLLITCMLLGGGIIQGLIGILAYYQGHESATFLFILAFGFLTCAIWYAWRKLLLWHLQVMVFAEGLLWVESNRVTMVPWDRLTKVWREIGRRYIGNVPSKNATYKYTIERRDGLRLVLDGVLDRIQALGATIEDEVTKRLLPQALQSYKAGERVSFGPFTVRDVGLMHRNQMLEWDHIARVECSRGSMRIIEKDSSLAWATEAAADIPNFFVLDALLQEIVPVVRDGA